MTRIHYKSDFDFILHLEGGFPSFNFGGTVTSGESNTSFVFSCINRKTRNCFNDNGKIHVVCDKHGLPPGKLMVELYAYLPNSLYLDGERTIVCKTPIDIELTRSGCTEPIDVPQVEAIIPYAVVDAFQLAVANGYQGTQEEFYESLNSLSASNEYSDERAVVHRFTAQTANGGKYAVHTKFPKIEMEIEEGFPLVYFTYNNENVPTYFAEPNQEICLKERLTDMSGMFAFLNLPLLESGLSDEELENIVAQMEQMIGKAPIISYPITSIDLSQLDTTGVTNMDGMFIGYCGTELDLSSFDVSSVTRLGWMTYYAYNLETINFSGWQLNVDKIENNMTDVIAGFLLCPNLKTFIMRGCNEEFIALAQQLNEEVFGGGLTIITD